MTPDYSKGCARYNEITCDCDLNANQCKGRDYYEQIQCDTIKSLKAQLSSLRSDNERLTIMATDAELLRTKLDYKTEENKRNILAINDLRKRCEDLEAALKGIIEDVDKQSMITWVSGKINTAKKLLSQ